MVESGVMRVVVSVEWKVESYSIENCKRPM